MERVGRLIKLLTSLQGADGKKLADLLASLGVSRRTFFRDLQALQSAGIPIYCGTDGNYRVPDTYLAPTPRMQVRDLFALLVTTHLGPLPGTNPFAAGAKDGLLTILATVPRPVAHACRQMLALIEVEPPRAPHAPTLNIVTTLLRCADERRECELRWTQPGRLVRSERMRPLRFVVTPAGWSVVGLPAAGTDALAVPLAELEHVRPLAANSATNAASAAGRGRRPAHNHAVEATIVLPGSVSAWRVHVCPLTLHRITRNSRHDWVLRLAGPDARSIADWVFTLGCSIIALKPPAVAAALEDRLREELSRVRGLHR